ncbi:MAG: F0F1 ATP synthase subunit delta [Dysgonamonadaceae bacterium]|jgi:F-type H+-transporting ATPase subunit delta|nr:F0F1 ATP synthase subunit delta [Dysgonamonadaceae bacterium]
MNAGIISTRYAKAIFQYARARGDEERLYTEMKTLSEQFTALPLLKKVLEDPTVSSAEKMKVLITAVGKTPSDAYQQAVRLVIKNERGHYMQQIAWVYDKVFRKEKNRTIIKLTTTQPAGEDTQKALIDLIIKDKDKQVDFAAKIDESIVGGFILEIEDLRLDASVKNQLNKLRRELIEN